MRRHLQIQLVDDPPHSKSPLELLGYEPWPRGFIALDLATILVKAKPRGLLSIEWCSYKAKPFLE